MKKKNLGWLWIFLAFLLFRLSGFHDFLHNLIGIGEGFLETAVTSTISLLILCVFYLFYKIVIGTSIEFFNQKKLVKEFVLKNDFEIRNISSFELLNSYQIRDVFFTFLNNAYNTASRNKLPETEWKNFYKEVVLTLSKEIKTISDPKEIKIMEKFISFYTEKSAQKTRERVQKVPKKNKKISWWWYPLLLLFSFVLAVIGIAVSSIISIILNILPNLNFSQGVVFSILPAIIIVKISHKISINRGLNPLKILKFITIAWVVLLTLDLLFVPESKYSNAGNNFGHLITYSLIFLVYFFREKRGLKI